MRIAYRFGPFDGELENVLNFDGAYIFREHRDGSGKVSLYQRMDEHESRVVNGRPRTYRVFAQLVTLERDEMAEVLEGRDLGGILERD